MGSSVTATAGPPGRRTPQRSVQGTRTVLALGAALAGIALAGLVVYAALDIEELELDDQTRQQLGGTYVRLSEGVTHYALTGPADGPVVVLLHGATISAWDFDLQREPLVQAGYRTLSFDAFGRGLSDRPEIDSTRELHARQLAELLDELQIEGPVALVGHSLGGAVAMHFAATRQSRVERVLLVSPVINSVQATAPFVVCRTPVLGPLLYRLFMRDVLARRANNQWAAAEVDRLHYAELYERQERIEGYQRAICSMFRGDLLGDYRPDYLRVDALGIPVALAYGAHDEVIGLEYAAALKRDTTNFTFRELEGAAHSPHVQALEEFNALMLEFLGGR